MASCDKYIVVLNKFKLYWLRKFGIRFLQTSFIELTAIFLVCFDLLREKLVTTDIIDLSASHTQNVSRMTALKRVSWDISPPCG